MTLVEALRKQWRRDCLPKYRGLAIDACLRVAIESCEMATPEKFGRSIKLFLTDGTPSGVITGSMANWTGKVLVGRSANLPALLSRSEVQQPGLTRI